MSVPPEEKRGSSETPRPGEDPTPEDEIARRLADVFGSGKGADPEAADDVGEGEPLRLDKTGALLDRPKLKPVKPYARPGKGGPSRDRDKAADDADRAGPQKAVLPPRLTGLRPAQAAPREATGPTAAAGSRVEIPAGRFRYGEEGKEREVPPFSIDRYPVTNGAYRAFVEATGHRPPLYWPNGQCPEELEGHPVVGVDYYDALAYARWCDADLPFEDEWERAARTIDGRTYPWGNEPEPDANTARLGLKMTLPVGWFDRNRTPEGVCDVVGNVWQMTHSPAPGGGIVVRGGSWYDFALYAKTWFRFASRPDARNGTIGFRCVRREHAREAPREVDASRVDAAIQARKGKGEMPDPASLSPERRDLVPDYRRLRHLADEREAERRASESLPPPAPQPVTPPREAPVTPARKAVLPPPLKAPATPKVETQRPAADAAPRAPAPSAPAPAPVPAPAAPPARAHVVGPPRPPAGPPAAPAPPRPAGATVRAQPALRWGLAAAAVVLAGLLVLLLVKAFSGGEKPVPPAGPPVAGTPAAAPAMGSLIPGLPEAPAEDARDQDPPTWLDGAGRGWTRVLDSGIHVLVFADTETSAGQSTIRTVKALHRRLRDRNVRPVLVLPRASFEVEGGALIDEAERRARLAALEADVDLTVLLDPAPGSVRRRYAVSDPIAAVVLVDGVLAHRTAPFEGGFTLFNIAKLVGRALEIRPQ